MIDMRGRSLFGALLVLVLFSTDKSPHLKRKMSRYHVHINPVSLARGKFARSLISRHANSSASRSTWGARPLWVTHEVDPKPGEPGPPLDLYVRLFRNETQLFICAFINV